MDQLVDFHAHGNRAAVITESGETIHYADLSRRCDALAARMGKRRKQLVFVVARNNTDTLVGYLAALRADHAVFLADGKMPRSLLKRLVDRYRPDCLWGPPDASDTVGRPGYELRTFNPDRGPVCHDRLALLLGTSGSTGSPKLVRLSRRNVDANARDIATYLNLGDDERPITNLPLHYSYGLSVVNSHLLVGATLLLTEKSVMEKGFWDMFSRYGGTSLGGVPYTYDILKRFGFERKTLPGLRYMTQAGGKLNHHQVREWAGLSRERGFDFYVMYGQTEATARIAYLPPGENLKRSKSVGVPIPSGEVWVEDAGGNRIARPEREGELVYRGPNVMMGYADGPGDLSRGDDMNGVLRTRDMGYLDAEGYIYITGRKSRFLKILGRRVSLNEMESYLRAEGFECACGGADDSVLIASPERDTFPALRKIATTRFRIPADMLHFRHVDRIEKSASGKIRYHLLFDDAPPDRSAEPAGVKQ